ncbi:phosphopantothenoylcysteine decarboxylase / phosphopantothenate--cysteine ligase [Xylanibacter ruminicola]|uniref:Coenzyme A biosynthesis bifunctional protein CoaBC n=1 Tax=Xylanibacter ruminicola TaxID=839 RepID=A0A1M7I429_XYLRU|nr:bifunctional phosphopantothenoylcysteine decarboxylase/phosphopantothenate--cysteine ligase CoaBC [Xylanibacter ruminicola]SFB76807.1 phosphopantothenoylcysteine decarboxylase / phosphopantothenate--cysteine ligase [Xylanibacter ruminicola]SHM35187.1 phosphopantothenoylcysteine decarboxylase / phosphopantothenate--cysteine ligase [Xylanibacter ruminicola]
MLNGKTIVLGVTGGIAAYKSANLASMLIKLHADVHVIMTQNATKFITPMTFETLTNNKCIVDTFDRNFSFDVKHVSLAKRGDLFVVAPCTANVIGKLAHGICDDMLTTTMLATRAPKLIAPAMNTGMWENPILQDNLTKLKGYGYHIIDPIIGRLACGDTGTGKMQAEEVIVEHILSFMAKEKDLAGKRYLITAGPTQEAIDPVRYITNHSSGKMGYAIAKMARLRGAHVTLVSGPVNIKPFCGVDVVPVKSAADMFEAVTSRSAEADVVIMCSAVADYTPAVYADQKVKKHDGELQIELKRTQDILGWLGEHKPANQTLVGFSMETENLIENSRTKLLKKHAQLICANSIAGGNTGFAVDTNKVTLISSQEVKELPLCSKEETADLIIDHIQTLA